MSVFTSSVAADGERKGAIPSAPLDLAAAFTPAQVK
jgi:hypothetical protein